MKAKKFDADFDSGKDITNELDLSKIQRPNQTQRRVNVGLPVWMIESLDKEAARLNCISHLLSVIPYEEIPFEEPKLPKIKKKDKNIQLKIADLRRKAKST